MKRKIFRKKSIEELLEVSSGEKGLNRVLGPIGLLMMGIGTIIGAGIFILTGIASAYYAGPAIIISFLISGIACLFTALCYAEFATMIPVAGSVYTYSYVTLGEIWAWIIGWDLVLEYLVIVAAVAIGWSNYFVEIFSSVGINLPSALVNPPGIEGGIINLPAVFIVFLIMSLLIIGVRESSRFNTVIVLIKLSVILLFIAIGIYHINPSNYNPFFPYGFIGVFKGAAIIFFAYIGFDALTTAAEEVKNPQRTLPIAIIGSLVISSILYIVVAAVLNGILPYSTFKETAAPIAFALQNIGIDWASTVISIGALCGITSVLLVGLFGQTRVFFAIARDGLLPEIFAKIHGKYNTPVTGIAVIGSIGAAIAAFIPISDVVQLVNIGTLAAFIIVSFAVIILRKTQPNILRPFKTPLVPLIPAIAIIFCVLLVIELPAITQLRFIIWLAIGLVIYYFYGRHKSNLNKNNITKTKRLK
ncbi:amino acid permease [Methanobacterium sp.]|uniref:amino acid permease n=1 Tax=Methanobacterium sp. TaxID=2164 RepID=UPI003C70FD70